MSTVAIGLVKVAAFVADHGEARTNYGLSQVGSKYDVGKVFVVQLSLSHISFRNN